MQPFMQGVIKRNPAEAYIVGMTSSDATLKSHIRTLIDGLVSDGVWEKLAYLGVVQSLEADTLRCLVRCTRAFSVLAQDTFQAPVFVADSGYAVDTSVSPARRGCLRSGYTPEPALLSLRDSYGMFQYLGSNGPDPGSLIGTMGRYSVTGPTDWAIYTERFTTADDRAGWSLSLEGAALCTDASGRNVSEFQYCGRDSINTIRVRKNTTNATAAKTRTGTWAMTPTYAPYATDIFHPGVNIDGVALCAQESGARLSAWGFTTQALSAGEIDSLRTRLNTYLTARGAI